MNHIECVSSPSPPLPSPPLPFPSLPSVGGIYTVVRSKADVTTAELGDDYVMIGPYNDSTVRLEVEVAEPDSSITREVVDQMRINGIKVGGARRGCVGGARKGGVGGARRGGCGLIHTSPRKLLQLC